MPGCAFLVFARAPVAGQVKTRLFRADPALAQAALGRTLSAEDAARLHAAFVEDVLGKGQRCGLNPRVLYVADSADSEILSRLAAVYGYSMRLQRGPNLGTRMAAAFDDQLATLAEVGAPTATGRSSDGAILVGTDSPTLPIAYLQQAAQALADGCDLVLGPACDGGYYLIGLRRPLPSLFPADMGWGTAEVLPRTLERLRGLASQGLRTHLLPFFYDCDTPGDLRLLREHLALSSVQSAAPAAVVTADHATQTEAPATQAVLEQLGLWG